MRTIEIKQDANGPQRWVAVDRNSGDVLLRMHDRGFENYRPRLADFIEKRRIAVA